MNLFNSFIYLMIAHAFISIIYFIMIWRVKSNFDISFQKRTTFQTLYSSEILEKVNNYISNPPVYKSLNRLLLIHNCITVTRIIIQLVIVIFILYTILLFSL